MSTEKKEMFKSKLTEARNQLTELFKALNEKQLHTPVIADGDEWTPINIVSHLVENERGMSIHIYKVRNGRETVPETFKVEDWNAGLKERMGQPSRNELLEALKETRAKTLEGLESLKDHEWELKGRHPDQGIITIEQYFETIASHDLHHIDDIKKGLSLK